MPPVPPDPVVPPLPPRPALPVVPEFPAVPVVPAEPLPLPPVPAVAPDPADPAASLLLPPELHASARQRICTARRRLIPLGLPGRGAAAQIRGERGIRTLGTFRYTRFPIVPLRPLGHLSGLFQRVISEERVGVEPTLDLRPNLISNQALSATQPPLQLKKGTLGGFLKPPAMGSDEQSSSSPDAIYSFKATYSF